MRNSLAALAGLCAFSGTAAAEDRQIDVGGTMITVPDPPGFTLVAPEMRSLAETIDRLLPATHTRYLAYIPEELALGALAGEQQDYLRLVTVQDIVGIGDRSLSRAQFRNVEKSIAEQNAKMLRELTVTGGGAEDRDPDIAAALEVGDYVPLPMHQETARTAAYIAFMPTSTMDAALGGERRMAATTTLVHARSKALLLNVGVLDSEVAWAESFSEEWAKAILVANEASGRR